MDSLVVGGHRLEVVRISGVPGQPTLVFLHEGLGSVSAWRSFPADLAHAVGCPALVYSRWGYGQSDPVTLPRPLDFMQREGALLPELLDAAAVERAILIGHSDGASIALCAAAGSERRIGGLILEAPHVFVEEMALQAIGEARDAFAGGDLRARLARHHADVDGAFHGWNDTWLDPRFRSFNLEALLPRVDVPVLVIQGSSDRYGTLAQVDAVVRGVSGPASRLVLADCGHAPHRDQPAAVLAAMSDFIRRHAM